MNETATSQETLPPGEKYTLTRAEQVWLSKWLKSIENQGELQTKLLDKINDKLGFFVFLAIVAIVISILSALFR